MKLAAESLYKYSGALMPSLSSPNTIRCSTSAETPSTSIAAAFVAVPVKIASVPSVPLFNILLMPLDAYMSPCMSPIKLPIKFDVITVAEKFPLASRFTSVDGVATLVAVDVSAIPLLI